MKSLKKKIFIIFAIILIIYCIASVYFINHYFFNTKINGVNVSFKTYKNASSMLDEKVNGYNLKIIERDFKVENISAQDIDIKYTNDESKLIYIKNKQNPLVWGFSLLVKEEKIDDLFTFDEDKLKEKIESLDMLNQDIIEPKNATFKYIGGSYEIVDEVYGNKLIYNNLYEKIKYSILHGAEEIDLDKNDCYENPTYLKNSQKTLEAQSKLNKYILSEINYTFGSRSELVGDSIIKNWLIVDDNMEVVIDEKQIKEYVKELSDLYDTAGGPREFKTATGKEVIVTGGYYGWKIAQGKEKEEIIKNIELGEKVQREPIYSKKAISREENDIGNTYVEINITRQYLWFHKDGKVVAQGSVVTGNISNGNGTRLGTYALSYKEKGATLRGADYESPVTYWMPFDGNIGIHDASWRYSFGGSIYKSSGSHGCVNAPIHLAKAIFNNIEPGVPIICYEE